MIARRLIAERCLYGVDLNPLAVELAKLSIWLVTLLTMPCTMNSSHHARSRPCGVTCSNATSCVYRHTSRTMEYGRNMFMNGTNHAPAAQPSLCSTGRPKACRFQ